jgi:naphthoate synthase
MSSVPSNRMPDVASMAAARDPSSREARVSRDGFELIPCTPVVYDQDLSDRFQDITYHKSSGDLCARIAFDRPNVLHAFRPITIREIQQALEDASDDPKVAVIVLTSNTNSFSLSKRWPYHSTTYTPSFCAGGDQRVRSSEGGYQDGSERAAKLRVLDLQVQMRRCPKPILTTIRGYAVGGGHILHMVSDLTLCSENAVLGQTGPRMGSFDAGYGCASAAALMGQKRARELWFLCRYYSAEEAQRMGLVNAVYPDKELEGATARWVRRITHQSPTALAATKASCNAVQDGAAGLSQMGGELTRLFYQSAEAQEGRQAFLEKRAPNFRSSL